MKRIIYFVLLSIFLSSCGLLGVHFNVHNPKKAGAYPKKTKQNKLFAETTKYRTCFDVEHYRLSIDVDPKKKSLGGSVVVSALAMNDFDTLQLDLYKNMNISRVALDNTTVPYNRVEGAVFITMPKTIKKGERFMLVVDYNGKPTPAKRPPWDGGFVWKKDKDGNPWIGVACESEGSSLWWPSKDIMSDEADSVDVFISVPTGLKAISNGVLMDTTHVLPQKTTFHWHVSYPINNYNVTLYIGNFKLLHDSYASTVSWKTTHLDHYVLPYNFEKAKLHFQQVKKHLAFYEKTFGEYPWQRDGFKLVESPYAGMEHQSAIAYGNGYKDDSYNGFDYIILHETAHEWWGNSVTAADLADAWIHEGFASYCEALYVESVSGQKAYLDYLYWQRITILNKRPVVRQREIRYFDYHDGDIYSKGSWILHTLRTNIDNDTVFFDILKTFYQENTRKQIFSETFMELVNRKTGQDYGWFFRQYLFRREAPFLEFCWAGDALYFKWTQVNDDFVMPVKIKVSDKTLFLFPTTKVQKVELSNKYPDFYDDSDKRYYGTRKNKKLIAEFNRSR